MRESNQWQHIRDETKVDVTRATIGSLSCHQWGGVDIETQVRTLVAIIISEVDSEVMFKVGDECRHGRR